MKMILLLAAIYTLIIHQSHKNAKEKISPAETKKVFNAANLPPESYRKQVFSSTIFYGGVGFVNNGVIFTRKEEKE
jgi:hypothetical protein